MTLSDNMERLLRDIAARRFVATDENFRTRIGLYKRGLITSLTVLPVTLTAKGQELVEKLKGGAA